MSFFHIFKIRKEERIQAAVFLAVVLFLNVLFILRMHELFMQEGFGPYKRVFEREFHLSGYDPYTYFSVTEWGVIYEVFRHPLLAFMIYPFHLLNEGLTAVFGVNCVQYVVALPVVLCSLYSYLFIYRIHREVIMLGKVDATLLSAFYFSFAYILLSVIVPDHFTVSMFLLLLMLYISGRCMQTGRKFRWWQATVLFLITAGVTLSNGIKVFLAGLAVNRRDFFRAKYLLLAVILPAGLLWGIALWQHKVFIVPQKEAQKVEKARQEKRIEERVARMDSAGQARFRARQERRAKVLRRQAEKSGTPMKQHGFWKWTDVSTSRWKSVCYNLFGEAVQFHKQHFLEDTLVHRPVFVAYEWRVNDVVEALVVLLALVGIWCGRKSRFLWLTLSCFAFDMFIHLVLGFGINEIFIMAPHWLFAIPLSLAYAFRSAKGNQHKALRGAVLVLTCWLLCYNAWLLIGFLRTPINATL